MIRWYTVVDLKVLVKNYDYEDRSSYEIPLKIVENTGL